MSSGRRWFAHRTLGATLCRKHLTIGCFDASNQLRLRSHAGIGKRRACAAVMAISVTSPEPRASEGTRGPTRCRNARLRE